MNKIYWVLALLTCYLLPINSTQALAADTSESFIRQTQASAPQTATTEAFSVFPVGLNVGKLNILPSTFVRGQENGKEAINFADWLISYDAVVASLKLSVKSLPDGQLEVRSPGLVTRIDPKQLINDPELGLAFSIKQLETIFGVTAQFDIIDYAITLNVPWLEKPASSVEDSTTAPIQLEGLPIVKAPKQALTAIEQRVNTSGSITSTPSLAGEMTAVGTVFNGSFFLRANQRDLTDFSTWNLAEAQYLRETDKADYAIGSQPTFWRSQASEQYWGFTTIQRQGFKTVVPLEGGSFSPNQRLQAQEIGRTIVGNAAPGTLVRLTRGLGDRPIAEVLVDSSRIYRFENLPVGGQSSGSYRVLLYLEGRLTAQPEIRSATFSNIPGQIPQGASATIVSGGWRRQLSGENNQNFLGDFTEFQGGIARRWGVSENLTVGAGLIYDQNIKGLGEIFYRPNNFPLEVAASVLSADKNGNWDINANVRLSPTKNVTAQFNTDKFSSQFNLDWRISPHLTLLGNYDSSRGWETGVQTSFSFGEWMSLGRFSIDAENHRNWNVYQRLGLLSFSHQGNDIGTTSQLEYNLSGSSISESGYSLQLGYETRNLNRLDNLATLAWRYRSPEQSSDGRNLWDVELGYGIGSRSSGPIVTLQTAAIPGLLVRGRYEGCSLSSDESSYSLEIVSSLNFDGGIFPGDRKSDRFRSVGGLAIQPFFDKNNNNKRDRGEQIYTENSDLLFALNNQPITSFRPEIQKQRILVPLVPGAYRLDIDPAGFPLDWEATVDSYAVDVVAGSYTSVLIPLRLSYTLSGVVTDTNGKPVAGARVEAIATKSDQRRFSVTNDAGVYYLERLPQSTYHIKVNDQVAQPNTVTLNESSQHFQELNIKL
ncbi:carboxypeptidase regulatory-like domain-containing protein [Nostoc sp. FACHB-152]|uniref:carboxypeptidase regulatory-like domain-containing protein n=1 Tax=unclassified Nostoc TaxID=2593658 RepID=UPI0016837447|nr:MULTISPECIES: carboxypeptidase regulatory-like domain-containing protein [unclassified Nostoc]MBD2451449.1 carboxypeptidase regulatory-like domain-containing protein [Nostoc sp. FACHB-152]MBD2469985.1 carboxypeptidase regulatory-like domain-containing protein [Nostoc sp. FACHB-145]